MIKTIGIRTLFLFIVGFILTLPFDFALLPTTGNWFKPTIERGGQSFFSLPDPLYYSDSFVMLIWTGILFVCSLIISFSWTLIVQKKQGSYLHYWIDRISVYYLALILLIYGFNKVFLYQFYIPEPNTLYTPLGQLTPDILYWSSMGSSSTYSIFAGLIELIPALLLFFRKTRLLGAFIAFGVLINVAFINWGFGITVKTFSFFLLLLATIILVPYLNRLSSAFFGDGTVARPLEIKKPSHVLYVKATPYLRVLVILFLLTESLMPYMRMGNFNGYKQAKPTLFGAYQVESNPNQVKRIFFHSAAYFILQTDQDEFFDYPMKWNGSQLELVNYEQDTTRLELITESDSTYQLIGDFYGTGVNWQMKELDLGTLPFFNP
jgi:hypothetical protein